MSSDAVPPGWSVRAVADMGRVLAGKALDATGSGAQRPYLRTKNVLDGRIDLQDVLHMPMTDAEFRRFTIAPGDVLLNEGQSLDLVGRCALYGAEHGDSYAMQNQLLRFRASSDTSPEFAAHLFRHCQANGTFASIATQTTSVAHLGSSRFAQLRLPWPDSRSEQDAIATALTNADRLIGGLEEIIVKKQAIKKAMMQELLTGQTRLPEFDGVWTPVKLRDVGQCLIGLTYSPTDVKPTGTLVLRSSNIQDGRLALSDSVHVSKPIPDEIRTRENDILICARNGSRRLIGKSVMIDTRLAGQTFGAFMVVFRSNMNPFLQYFFQSDLFYRQVKEHLGATINQITNRSLNGFAADLPPLEEQKAITALLTNIDDELSVFDVQLNKARSLRQSMIQHLLTGRTRLPLEETAA